MSGEGFIDNLRDYQFLYSHLSGKTFIAEYVYLDSQLNSVSLSALPLNSLYKSPEDRDGTFLRNVAI